MRSAARQPKCRAPWSFYNERWAPRLDFTMGLSVAGGWDLSPRHSTHQQMGFIWSLLVPPSQESWKDTPLWVFFKTLDRLEVLLHKLTTWRNVLQPVLIDFWKLMEVLNSQLYWMPKKELTQSWLMHPLHFLQMDRVVVYFNTWNRGGQLVFHGLHLACRYFVWPTQYLKKIFGLDASV